MQNLQAFYFGLIVALSIGPGALLILNRGIKCGFKSAAYSGLGAAAGDFVYGFLAFSVGGWIGQLLLSSQNLLKVLSGSFLMALAIYIIFTSSRKQIALNDKGCSQKRRKLFRNFLSLFALTLSNPLTIIIFLGFLGSTQGYQTLFNAFTCAFFVFIGSLLVQLGLALSSVYLGNWLKKPAYIQHFNRASAVGLFIFGLNYFI